MLMKWHVPGLFLVFALLSFTSPVHPASEVSVRILQTDPPSGTELDGREPLYVRIAYESDVPLRFQARPYRDGQPVSRSAAYNPSPAYRAGRGETVAWVSFDDATVIDEIRVKVSDGQWQPVSTVSRRIDIRWNGVMPAQWRTPADWVERLSGAQQQMVSQAALESGSGSSGGGDLLIPLMGLSVPGYLLLQIWFLASWRDGWRKAAMVPLLVMIPLTLYTVFALMAGSNLWPLALLFLAPIAFASLCVLGLVRAVFGTSGAAGRA